jgi:hypothetical protein
MRNLIVAQDGYVLLQIDQAGAEAVVVSKMTPPGSSYRNLFDNGVKPHVFFALRRFADDWRTEFAWKENSIDDFLNATPDVFTKFPQWPDFKKAIANHEIRYFIGKRTCHSFNYDVRARTYCEQCLKDSNGRLVLSIKEGEQNLREAANLFPDVSGFQFTVQDMLKRSGKLVNLFGDERHFNGPIDDTMYRAGYAWIPQSTVGVITIQAHCELQEGLDSGAYSGFEILQNNHDSLLARTTPELAVRVGAILTKHINRRMISPYGEEFFMKSEIGKGPDWEAITEFSKDEYAEMKSYAR